MNLIISTSPVWYSVSAAKVGPVKIPHHPERSAASPFPPVSSVIGLILCPLTPSASLPSKQTCSPTQAEPSQPRKTEWESPAEYSRLVSLVRPYPSIHSLFPSFLPV